MRALYYIIYIRHIDWISSADTCIYAYVSSTALICSFNLCSRCNRGYIVILSVCWALIFFFNGVINF